MQNAKSLNHFHMSFILGFHLAKRYKEFGQKIKWVLKSAQLQGKESSVETFVGSPIETPALVSQTLSHSYHYFHNFAKYIRKRAYRESYLVTEKS